MAQDFHINGYYEALNNNFIDTAYCCKLGMEFLLSKLLFKGDISRVVYSKEDIAFRRRVETLGDGYVKNENDISYLTLNLPYAVYSQVGSFEEDDRGSTQNASQIVKGYVDPMTGITVKTAAVKIAYEATAFFSKLEDVDKAGTLLYWEKTPKYPLYYIVQHDLCGQPIDIPVFITLDEVDTTPSYTAEAKKWLEQAKIYPIKLKFTIRSYQTLIEDVEGYMKLPLRFSGIYTYNNDEEVVFTQKTSLIWANHKWNGSDGHPHITDFETANKVTTMVGDELPVPEDEEMATVSEAAREDLETNMEDYGKLQKDQTEGAVTDAVIGYFSESRDCVLDEFYVDDENTTEHEAMIKWEIKQAHVKHFDNIEIYIPGLLQTKIEDPTITNFTVDGLNPGSTYDCTLVIMSKNASKLTYKLKITTKGQKVVGNKLSDRLVGRTFTGVSLQ